jgi:hypothetical protein
LKRVSYFSDGKKCLMICHVYHAFHHKVTTKTPRLHTCFRQKPLQKRQSTTAKIALSNRVLNSDAQQKVA